METVMVDELEYPKIIQSPASSKALQLTGHGITDMEIHFLQIKFTAIGVYFNANDVASHLQAWKAKTSAQILQDDALFETLVQAPLEKVIRVVVIKEIKGAQYGLQLENAVRDRLVAIDKYEDDEETALEQLVEFFQGKYMKKNSVITFHFNPLSSPKTIEVSFLPEGKEENKLSKTTVENENVAEALAKWYLGGSSAVSAPTISSLCEGLATLLGQ